MKNILNLNGDLMTIREVNEDLCEGGQVIKGVIGTQNGAYSFYDSSQTESKEDNEINGEVMEYVKLENVKNLYGEFMEDLEDGIEEVVSCCVDETDVCLRAITKSVFNNTVYIYNYSRKEDNGVVEKLQTITDKKMLRKLFVA